ncbi:MAG: hypothetical protein WA045_10470 [Nitrospira sp.]
MNTALEQAIRFALEDEDHNVRLELCPHCGAIRHKLGEHRCRTEPLHFEGMESDDKKRARSYAIE